MEQFVEVAEAEDGEQHNRAQWISLVSASSWVRDEAEGGIRPYEYSQIMGQFITKRMFKIKVVMYKVVDPGLLS